jgi:alpha-beta hydrolase superfamily lysophospholipase
MISNLLKAAKKVFHLSRRLMSVVISSLLGAFVVIVVLAVFELNSRPDLSVWHTTVLDKEFNADSGLKTFDEYLELEERLFEQLDQQIYQQIEKNDQRAINRYFRGSHSDPDRWPTNWNRSFVLPVEKPTIGVLLIHGMSDSPYSLRSIGQLLHDRGAYVIGMRVPGHGQAPSGLLDTEWEDMAAAVRLAVSELQDKSTDVPSYIVGYSNGGALAVQYTLDSLSDESLETVDGLILMSPEIGISKLAVLAKWQERLGHLLGLEKLAWNSLLPEYDPWKYGSFALNAAKQAHEITLEIQRQITRHKKTGTLDRFPPVLAFQSVVDSTVTAPALVNNLFERLPAIPTKQGGGNQAIHELVLFDINRYAEIGPLMRSNPSAWIDPMLENNNPNYLLTLMSNRSSEHTSVLAFSRKSGSSTILRCDTALSWPDDVYSLSHVALPIPPDDPVYGGDEAGPSAGISLGDLSLRGEKGVLHMPAGDLLRLRYNPFHAYLRNRILGFMGLGLDPEGFCLSLEPIEQGTAYIRESP